VNGDFPKTEEVRYRICRVISKMVLQNHLCSMFCDFSTLYATKTPKLNLTVALPNPHSCFDDGRYQFHRGYLRCGATNSQRLIQDGCYEIAQQDRRYGNCRPVLDRRYEMCRVILQGRFCKF
jgi:hypothetical protein